MANFQCVDPKYFINWEGYILFKIPSKIFMLDLFLVQIKDLIFYDWAKIENNYLDP